MGFVFTIVSYLIGVFIFATIVGQVGNVITNRNANRLEFERLLDGAKTYMRHHKVPSGMKRRVLRWYDYSWSRGRIQGGGDINTALGLLPDKLKTELALHVNLSVLKKVTIFQECQPEFLHDLVLKMKAFIFTPGDLICRKGEVAREMFIIADGILEVISETGHVLTTMMAGDFFGEIGILNLDGLNKRTADVRSVGYSELFSLSREDVLAAMKDYPEAQEILQTLGRKRLMEARNVTKAVIEQRKQAELKAMVQNAALASEHRSKNKIVERIYSDVKGLKSVLRKSRRGTKSEDSLELQPLTSISGKTENQLQAGSKGTLCRMQKVRSEDNEFGEGSAPPPTERRISAGFPLLNKLKTLTQSHHHQLSVRSDSDDHHQVEPAKEEAEIEPIGVGLPLLQRLLLLKQKEDNEKSSGASYVPSTVRTQHQQQLTCSSQSISLQHRKSKATTKKEVVFAEDVLHKEDESTTSKSSKHHEKREFCMKPWCLLRKATMNQNRHRGNHDSKVKLLRYEGLSTTTTSSSKSPAVATAALDDTVSAREGRLNSVNTHRCLTRLYGSGMKSAQSTICATQNAKMYDHTLVNINICDTSEANVRISNSNSNNSNNNNSNNNNNNNNNNNDNTNNDNNTNNINNNNNNNNNNTASNNVNSSSNSASSGSCEVTCSSSSKGINVGGEDSTNRLQLPTSTRRPTRAGDLQSKTYDSVDDLSPEYTGLPFVKKLKILNERQKLAEFEERFVRSCSLDSSNEVTVANRTPVGGLIRSSSEAAATQMYGLRSLPTPKHDLPSPESCETLERRKLKSVLKRISSGSCRIGDLLRCTRPSTESSGSSALVGDVQWFRRLMNAQTVEGYVARHSTFEKSITCRSTLLSPPSTERTLKSSPTDGQRFSFDECSSLIPISIDQTTTTQDGDSTSDVTAGERKYLDRESSHSPSKNPDLIPQVDVVEEDSCRYQLPIFASSQQHHHHQSSSESYGRSPCSTFSRDAFEGMQSMFKSQVKEIEQEVRKRDMLIEVLQMRIQELQRHHEQCFQECTSSDDTDCDTPEPAFLRGDSIDTVLLSPSHMSSPETNQEYHRHIDQSSLEGQSTFALPNRRSWEIPSEEDNLELRDLPSSMKPCPMWREDISIDIASDTDTSASETDELFGPLEDDDLQLANHDQDWEVRMLARELEKREHNESQFYHHHQHHQHRMDPVNTSSHGVQKTQLLNVRSLEERGTVSTAEAPSQRSISSDNIFYSSVVRHNPEESSFRTSSSTSTTAAVRTSSVSPDVVPLPVVTKSPSGS